MSDASRYWAYHMGSRFLPVLVDVPLNFYSCVERVRHAIWIPETNCLSGVPRCRRVTDNLVNFASVLQIFQSEFCAQQRMFRIFCALFCFSRGEIGTDLGGLRKRSNTILLHDVAQLATASGFL